jgi:8-hydroxy-5-deazaflavin:NADPH oxidoreductase
MNIGIIGSGNVAKALAEGLVRTGHAVKIGARNPSKLEDWKIAPVDTLEAAARFGELLILAPSFAGLENAIELAGKTNFNGKTVVDVTNPIRFDQGQFDLIIGTTDSAGEVVQRLLPQSHVVKAFNTVGPAIMTHPEVVDGADMFIAGDHDAAKAQVSQVLEAFGWVVRDLGGIENSRWLEAMVMMVISYGMKHGVQNNAFQLKTA